jgi:hypothetical protein
MQPCVAHHHAPDNQSPDRQGAYGKRTHGNGADCHGSSSDCASASLSGISKSLHTSLLILVSAMNRSGAAGKITVYDF